MTISCPSSLSSNYRSRHLLDPVRLSSFVTSFDLTSYIVMSKSSEESPDSLIGDQHISLQTIVFSCSFLINNSKRKKAANWHL